MVLSSHAFVCLLFVFLFITPIVVNSQISNSFTFFYNENLKRSEAIINCNSTQNTCSSPSQMFRYVESISSDSNTLVDIQIILLSNLTQDGKLHHVEMRNFAISSYGPEFFTISIPFPLISLFSNSLENLLFESVKISQFNYNRFSKKVYFQACTIEHSNLATSNVYFNNSLILESIFNCYRDSKFENSKFLQTKFSFLQGNTFENAILENCTLDSSSGGFNISDSNIISTNFTSESGNFTLDASQVANSYFDLRIGIFSLINNTKFVKSSLEFIGIQNSDIYNSFFTMNCSISMIGIRIVSIFNSKFHYNSNLLSLEYTSLVELSYCEFIRNFQPIRIINTERLISDSNGMKISSCFFEGNQAELGGVIYSEFTTINSASTTFTSNTASNGGVLYLKNSHFTDFYSEFFNNFAVSKNCFFLPDCGNGGVVFSSNSHVNFQQSSITENEAVKGAVCYNDCSFGLLEELDDNSALYAGNIIYYETTTPDRYPFQPEYLLNNDFSCRALRKVHWRVSGATEYYSSMDYTILSLYPGQLLSIRLIYATDMLNNTFNSYQTIPIIYTDSKGHKIVSTSSGYENTTLNIYVTANSDVEKVLNATILFSDRDFKFTIGIRVEKCPFDYSLDESTNICVFKGYTAIILASIFGSIIFFLFLICGLIVCLKIIQALLKLHKREKKEKLLANKIIDKKFIFGEDSEDSPLLPKLISINSNNIMIPIENIEIIKKIGEGSNGVVYLANWNSHKVALKSIKTEINGTFNEEFEYEASLLYSLRHPCIVRFYGVSFSNTKYMVVEYLENGSLDSIISQCKYGRKTLNFKKKLEILKGIASGMDYLHSLKPKALIHRDLKPGNILLDSNMNPKVCDFGLSKLTSNSGSSTMTMNLGTMLYMAPEIIGSGYEIGPAIDVYSFSMIMFELFFMEKPFFPSNQRETEQDAQNYSFSVPLRVVKGERPEIYWNNERELKIWIENSSNEYSNLPIECLGEYNNLMKDCWDQNPLNRPNFKQIIQKIDQIILSLE